jgi:hypothetical protein
MYRRGWLASFLFVVGDATTSCSGGSKPVQPPAPLTVATFDVAEAGWGDIPLPVHFVWHITGGSGHALTCRILDLRPQLRVLLAQVLIVGEECRDHRSKVGDLLFELRDSAVALVLHTYV